MLENKEIKKGILSSENFANALLMIPLSCLSNIIVDIDNMEKGYLSFTFFKNGEWKYIIIDTLLPYSHQKKSLLYTSNKQPNIFFFAFLEKAYAKLNGGYDKINFISIEDIIVDLTNGLFEKIQFSLPNQNSVNLNIFLIKNR